MADYGNLQKKKLFFSTPFKVYAQHQFQKTAKV